MFFELRSVLLPNSLVLIAYHPIESYFMSGNAVHFTFIFTFFVKLFHKSSFDTQLYFKYSNLKQIIRTQMYSFNYSNIIIIIMSRRQRGYPWPSLAISPYHSSPPAGLQGYILCPHIVAVCKFVLVVLLLHIHMWGSTGVHRLWARPCFSSSVPRVWFVWLV